MIIPALIAGGATLLSAIIGGIASSEASKAQTETAKLGIAEQNKRFEEMQAMLAPYAKAGEGALTSQQALAGLAGPEAQRAAIAAIQGSPEMQALTEQGEAGILSNASATGGLRGGNVQSALAQFRPQVLSSLINQQYQRLGGITQMGQASAAGVGAGGLQTGMSIADLLGQQGAAQAGGILGLGQAAQGIPNAFMTGLGTYAGLGGKF